MNSLDAIIAMLILLSGLALLLGGLAEQSRRLDGGKESIQAKLGALECMTIIDGMYAGSVDLYDSEFNCFVENGRIKLKIGEVEKVVSVIPKIRKKHFLEVDTIDHYQ